MDFASSFHLARDDDEYDQYCELSYQLSCQLQKKKISKLTKVKLTSLLEIIQLIIDDYVKKNLDFGDASPVETLKYLMEQHELKQVDLKDAIGHQSVVSEILNGKRSISAKMAKKLGEKFHTNPSVFI